MRSETGGGNIKAVGRTSQSLYPDHSSRCLPHILVGPSTDEALAALSETNAVFYASARQLEQRRASNRQTSTSWIVGLILDAGENDASDRRPP